MGIDMEMWRDWVKDGHSLGYFGSFLGSVGFSGVEIFRCESTDFLDRDSLSRDFVIEVVERTIDGSGNGGCGRYRRSRRVQ